MSADQSQGTARSNGAVPSSPAEIEAVIAARREHLAATIDELTQRTQPREIARRSVAHAGARFAAATRTDDGRLRTEKLAAIAGAVVATLALFAVLRSRRRR